MLTNDPKVGECMSASKISIVLESLSNGDWHLIDDLVSETKLDREMMLKVVNFFRDFGFIEISIGGEAAKLDKDYLQL
ncbi:MAG: hypothetical protein ABSA11_09825 [Candidatus Bathyarchaeia archaeon]|jgi:hypothetical protein